MSNLKYLYVRNIYKKRDITIVSDVYDENGKTYVKAAWAFRCNHDKFIKKEGRKVALERLNVLDPNYSTVFETEEVKFYHIAAIILSEILTSQSTPKKYLEDIHDDLRYFTECALHGRPSWDSLFSKEDLLSDEDFDV